MPRAFVPTNRGHIFFAFTLLLPLIGCGIQHEVSLSPLTISVTGHVHGGQEPVTGAVIQLYAAATSGDGSPATPLIGARLTTSDGTGNGQNGNANSGNASNTLPAGAFNITGAYTCPSASSQVYLVASGGNPGLPSGANPNLALMAALGSCGNLSSATSINVNELTTVGSVAALASFMDSFASLGSDTTGIPALQAAFAQVRVYTDVSAGTVPGPDLQPGYYASSIEIRTLADALASCVNSAGGVAGDSSPCGGLFQATTTPGGIAPTDTIGAAINLLRFPTQNVNQVFALVAATAPFQPVMPAAPSYWSVAAYPAGATAPAVGWPSMYGLDYWLPLTEGSGTEVNDATGHGFNGVIAGGSTPAVWPGKVGLILNDQTIVLQNASGRASAGYCAYFPGGPKPNNGGYVYGLASYFVGGGQNGMNLSSIYGPGNGIYNGVNAWFPTVGRSNGAPSTYSADGFSGIHCVEAVPGGALDRIVVDGREVNYGVQGSTADVVGGSELTAPLYIIGGSGNQFGAPIVIYSVWATSEVDSVAQAEARTASEMARISYLGVPFGIVPSNATDSTCSIDGTSIDQGYKATGTPTSGMLNLDFPCTIQDFSQSGQPPLDILAAFQDRAGRVFHALAPRNIAYHGGVIDGVIKYLEPPQLALEDVLGWNAKAHALGYKTIVSTMMSACPTGYNGETGDQLAQEFNALLLAKADQFDWVDNLAAWPQLGATQACSGPAFADGVHPNSAVGQPLYVANERMGFEGVYGTDSTSVTGEYTQLSSDRNIQAGGSSSYTIHLIDANSASFNRAGRLCVANVGSGIVTLSPVSSEAIDGQPSATVAGHTTLCVRPVVADPLAAGANWTAQPFPQ